MSAEKITEQVEELKRQAEGTNSLARLWVIEERLKQLGAWTEAGSVARKAKQIEDMAYEAEG
jgi:hypothetical protein